MLKVGFGLRRDAPIEEIEVDISSFSEEEDIKDEPDVEGEAEEEVIDSDDNNEDHSHKDDLWDTYFWTFYY